MTPLRRPMPLKPWTCASCARRSLSKSLRHQSPSNQPQTRPYTRPSIAPKPHLDIKHISKNPGLYSQNCTDRRYEALAQYPWRILELSQQRAALRAQTNDLRMRNAEARRKIERLRMTERDSKRQLTNNAVMAGLLQQGKKLKDELSAFDADEAAIEKQLEELALALPNLSSTQTPDGDEPRVLDVWESPASTALRETPGKAASHVDIGAQLGLLDFAGAAQTSGWGWYFLLGHGALLEQALVQFAIGKLVKRGWRVVVPPSMVYSHIAGACGFQPRDQHEETQIYSIEKPQRDGAADKPGLCLAGTAEIPLAGMYANKTLDITELPLKTVAVSRCYRAEAGARGADTKGLYRVHEFTKVEMFAWTPPDDFGDQTFNSDKNDTPSTTIFDNMVSVQREILTELGLTHRVLEMPAHELGASASRKIDIEVWFPSRTEVDQGWGEVTSASICTDYQSRRLATKVKTKSGALDWPYTINGTAMAVPRVLAAILETHWDAEKHSVKVPDCLVPYMHGVGEISKV